MSTREERYPEFYEMLRRKQERAAALARGEQLDGVPIPRLDGLYRESQAAHKGAMKQHQAEVAASPYAYKVPASHLPPGSKFAPSKEQIVNPSND